MRKLSALLVALLLTASCATVASHEEYGAYRAVRLAEGDRDRLVAMATYATEHPNGFWIEEIQEQRRAREETVWAENNSSQEGLEWYLEVYPDGRYVDQARPRLAALQTVEVRRDGEAERQAELEAERRRQAEEARRTWVNRAVSFWVQTLVGIQNYGSPISRVARGNREFSRAFGQPPEPTCTPEFCIKQYAQTYHIPVPGATRIDRRMAVILRLVLENGRVERAELLLPNKGFSRWYEMENRTVVTDEDPEQRQAAINWALDLITPVLREAASGARPIDFVAEPIMPLQVAASRATEEAPTAPDQATPEPEASPAAEGEGAAEQPRGELDDLLQQAAGSVDEPAEQADAEPVPEVEPEALVLPVNLIAVRHRNLRVVVFAAGDEDYGGGYDGIFVERIRD